MSLLFSSLAFGHKGQSWKYASTLDFELRQGQFLVLLGRNGTGKSTLLHTLGRRIAPLSGAILWQGQALHDLSAEAAAQLMAWVSAADRPEIDFMSLRDLVAMGRYPHTGWWGKLTPKDESQIEWALETLHISTQLAQQPLRQCSEGERQLAALARALAQDSPILLLDEATAHLDFVHRRNVFRHLQDIAHRHQKLIILATHELDLAAEYADMALALLPPNWCLDTAKNSVEQLINQHSQT